jgi:DNA-binding winged helix-turn-helix (wHTH) protein/predicted ATPase
MGQRRLGAAPAGALAPTSGGQALHGWEFDAFRVDLRDERLWRGPDVLPVHPKTFAVLCRLVTQAGQLVTKDALLEAVWPETAVREAVLHVAIRELRRVLGDPARAPRLIETIHGRGYRFIAPVRPLASVGWLEAPRPIPPPFFRRPPYFVGRDAELTQLTQWFTTACQGTRHVGIIAGEPGIGKTALVETFVAQVTATADVWVAHGQCLEPYGVGEPYLPVLDAFSRLGRDAAGAALLPVLQQYAPSWLMHLPTLLPPAERERLAHTARDVTPTRMLRELAEALEVLTTERPLVLVLEDLHWSDHATLAWFAYVARRRDPARLLLLGTYRPVEAIVHAHPLRPLLAELQHQAQCVELGLDYLSVPAVAAYLIRRGTATALPAGLPRLVHQRTSGHPLFLVALVDELVRQQLLATVGNAGGRQWAAVLSEMVPTSLRQYIEQHLEQLSEADQALLDAASVAGSTFAVAAVAAGVAQAPEAIEARLTALARQRQFIRARGTETWPDGTVTACYQFLHAVYHEVVYARVSAGLRVRLHQQVGARKEAGYGDQAWQIAGELAMHFTRGHAAGRAVRYLHAAGEQALRRSAYPEAITHLTTGLALLATLPETAARAQQELDLQIALGPALIATKGQAALEVEQTYARARLLCAQVSDAPQVFSILRGLCVFYRNRGALRTARELGDQLVRLAQCDATLIHGLEAHMHLGLTCAFMGEHGAARMHLEQGSALTAPRVHPGRTRGGHIIVPEVGCLVYAAPTLWCLGYPAQALERSQAALALATTLAHQHSLATARNFTIVLHYFRRDATAVQAEADALLTLAAAQAFPLWQGIGTCWRGWALAMQGEGKVGLAQLRQGLAAVVATGQELSHPFGLMLLAEVVGDMDQVEEGLGWLAEVLTGLAATGRGDVLVEAYRLQGTLLLRQGAPYGAQAEACFQQALTVARQQQAKSWELRAAMSLSRLWQQQGKRAEAYALLAPLYGWFTEGFETADLQDAKVLLDELA